MTRSPIDFFFRYDFFVAYCWSDGRTYAVRLRDQLKAHGFIVFLDSSDYAKGDNWREEGRRALARSNRLLLVASPEVFGSEAVRHEVEIFAGLGRRILPIDIAGTLGSAGSPERLLELLPPELLRFTESKRDCLLTGPSPGVVEDIRRSFDLIQQQTRRVRMLTGVIVVLACLLVLAALLGLYANTKRRQALAESEAKELQRLVAEGGRASAILDDPAELSAGLAIAAANVFEARNAHRPVPRGLHLALLRAVWAATPYRVLPHHLSPSAQARVLPDGKVIAIADDEKVTVTDPPAGTAAPLSLRDLPATPRRIGVSHDGTKVLALAGTGSLRVWRIDGALVRALEAPDGFIVSAAFVGEDTVLTASRSGAVRAWPLAGAGTGRLVWSVRSGIVNMAVAPHGDRIAVADDGAPDPGVRIRDLASNRELVFDPKGPLYRTTSLAFSPDGTRLVSADEGGQVRLWDTHTGAPISEIRPSEEQVSEVAFSSDGRRVAIACFDKTVHVWDLQQRRTQVLYGHLGPVISVAFAPAGNQLLSASEDGTFRLWSLGQHYGITVLDGSMRSVCGQATTAQGDRIALIGQDKRVHIFDTSTGRGLRDLGYPEAAARSASFSPDGTRVVTASVRDGIVVWDAIAGKPISARDEMSRAQFVAFAYTDDRVLFAGTSGVAGEWTLGGGVTNLSIPNGQSVYAIASSPDGLQLATTGQGGGVQIWNADGSPRVQLGGNAVFGNSACFTRESDRLLTAGGDGIAYLWDLRRRSRLLTLAGHGDAVATATFSLDQALIYTASDDHSVRIWDAASGIQVGRLVLPGAAHDAVELPGHRFAVTTSGQIWLGSTSVDDLLASACAMVAIGSLDRAPAAESNELMRDCAKSGLGPLDAGGR